MGDIFGNLLDWGRVMEQIAELRDAGKLDEHQDGLRRILRYPDNWRLRETVLGCVKDLSAPSEEIISEVLAIMRNDNIYWEARVMAAEALGHVVGRRESIGAELAHEVVEAMEAILARTQPSQFHDAIRRSLPTVGTREDRPEA